MAAKAAPLSLALHLARMWRTFEVRDGKVFAIGDDSGKPVCTPATLERMVELGWFTPQLRRKDRYDLTRDGMRAWIAEQAQKQR